VGDQLLRLVAQRLRSVQRPDDTVARFGGDEFAVLCPGVSDVASVERIAQRLVDVLAEPFALDQITLHVGASVGIALYPQHADGMDKLVQRADIALYQAKAERGSIATYDERNDSSSVERLTLMEQLRTGLETELVVHYQPKCRASDGALVGAEALVRWQHPEHGLLQPAQFLPPRRTPVSSYR
jgi:predicted signal transduction protein with EAL and GGDEF domain